MGILRDLFDIFIELRNAKESRRKEYFDNVVLQTFDQLRAVNEDFLRVFSECLEILIKPKTNIDHIIKHLEVQRSKMRTHRHEIYTKSRVDYIRNTDILLLIGEEENEAIREFLLACREYFETKSIYQHELANAIINLQTELMISVSSERNDPKHRRGGMAHAEDRRLQILRVANEIRRTQDIVAGRWHRVTSAFAEVRKRFV